LPEAPRKSAWYRRVAIGLAVGAVVSGAVFLNLSMNSQPLPQDLPSAPPPETPKEPDEVEFLKLNAAELALAGSFVTFVLTSLGSLTTIIVRWRQEKRQNREWMLKMAQLELQLAEQKEARTARKGAAGQTRRKGPAAEG
jgi:hypothetical protein